MDTKLIAFVLRWLGVPRVGTNAVNKGQCVGLVEQWLQAQGLPPVGGNAVDLLANADPRHYGKTTNGPHNFPQAGACVCWDGSWGAGYGHTAIALAASSMYLVVFEQNDPTGSPPIVATHDYQGVLGWFTGK